MALPHLQPLRFAFSLFAWDCCCVVATELQIAAGVDVGVDTVEIDVATVFLCPFSSSPSVFLLIVILFPTPVYKTEYMAEPLETVFMEGGLRICCEVIVAVVVVAVALVTDVGDATATVVAEGMIADVVGAPDADTLKVTDAFESEFVIPAAFTAEAILIGTPPRACACAS